MEQDLRLVGRRLAGLVGLIGLLVAGGCGYQFIGESSLLPKDIRTIYVEPFFNRNRDVGLERELASALRSEISRKGRRRVPDQAEQADVILVGVFPSLDSTVDKRFDVNRPDV